MHDLLKIDPFSQQKLTIKHDDIKSLLSHVDITDTAKHKIIVIDVRNADERAEGKLNLPVAQNIVDYHCPVSQLMENTNRIISMETDDAVFICYCAKGIRSKKAAEFLRTRGVLAFSLEDGYPQL